MKLSRSACIVWLLGSVAQACSIPVFRYALDRWPADPYVLEVSPNDAREEGVARFLRNFTDSTPINVRPVRLQEDGPSHLQFPHQEGASSPAWSGLLGLALPSLIDSPARSEIVQRILAGENGVWVLVESGKRDADEAAAKLMEKRLRYLEQVAQLPQIDPTDPSSRLGPGPALRVKFSLLRVRADDSAEYPFLRMLAGPKSEGRVSDEPWFALVFGRGRVLGAWPANDFGDEQIDEACLFLLGACSCQVKRMNPGWDLLLHVDWHERLQAIGFPASPATPETAPVTVKVEPSEAPSTAARSQAEVGISAIPLAGAAAALVLFAAGAAWAFWRK